MDESFGDTSIMLDARGIPTRECPSCASTLFTIQAVFNDEYEVAMYLLNAECAMCHTKITAPTPLDLPNIERGD